MYLDSDDASYYSESFIGVHSWRAGVRRLELPGAEPLYDVLTGRSYSAAKCHEVDLAAKRTALYYRGSEEQWQELLNRVDV